MVNFKNFFNFIIEKREKEEKDSNLIKKDENDLKNLEFLMLISKYF